MGLSRPYRLLMLRSKLSSLREYLTPINHNSNYETSGEISPEEFVQAGDYLVYKFPTWQWGSAPKKLQKDFLPPDKQFLITKHVPSYQRAQSYLGNTEDLAEDEEELDDGWVKSHRLTHEDPKRDIATDKKVPDIEDLDDFIDEDAEDADGEEFQDLGNSNLRRYDLYITYSTSYRVPKMYLVGFNDNGIPLLPQQMFEDISGDYRDKTATIENLPVSFNTTSVSIHPCKHSSVMKVLMKHAKTSREKTRESPETVAAGNAENVEPPPEAGIRVDQYLVVFLKFIASVTPGIGYDYTMDAL
ncbi:Autophagy-related protein 3 [Meyerozyma sp. JA9]|nr:Autophagy-related protein 3 [Meyerozyma sp. JA9]